MAAHSQALWQSARVVTAAPVAENIRQLVIEVDTPRAAPPGSHIDVAIPTVSADNRRSYSVVKADRPGSKLTIAVNLDANSRGGSKFMHSLRPGDELRITQPQQNFPLRTGAERYVLLAGGVGITALLAMARTLKDLGSDYRLVYVGRRRARMAYLDELIESHGAKLAVHDESRPLDAAVLVDEVAAQGRTEFYMCGPIRLMDGVRRRWYQRGLPADELRYETFGNSGWFDVEEFAVEVPRLGVVTTVGKGESLLEALEAAGVGVISDCLKGECGLCQVRVLRVEGGIDHRDVFFSDAQKSTSSKMCACVSRAARNAGGVHKALVTIDVP